jgi:two-component system chemotaxis response regulator CheB
MSMLRVLVVDDSAFVRKAVRRVLDTTPDLKVVADAATGAEALSAVARMRIDVVTLGVQLPDVSGLVVLRQLRSLRPDLPVLMLSARTQQGAAETVEALTLGAVDFVDKTQFGSLDLARLGSELMAKIRAVSQKAPPPEPQPARQLGPLDLGQIKLCVVGASTGGPAAVQSLLQGARADLSFPIVVAQHMPAGFTAAFAARLDALCALRVSELKPNERLSGGRAYIVPGDRHARLTGSAQVELFEEPALGPYVPCVDELFASAARSAVGPILGVLLTGMGRDGARGLLSIREAGGFTVGQDEASSVVYGMPRAAKEIGAVQHELSLADICAAFRR